MASKLYMLVMSVMFALLSKTGHSGTHLDRPWFDWAGGSVPYYFNVSFLRRFSPVLLTVSRWPSPMTTGQWFYHFEAIYNSIVSTLFSQYMFYHSGIISKQLILFKISILILNSTKNKNTNINRNFFYKKVSENLSSSFIHCKRIRKSMSWHFTQSLRL